MQCKCGRTSATKRRVVALRTYPLSISDASSRSCDKRGQDLRGPQRDTGEKARERSQNGSGAYLVIPQSVPETRPHPCILKLPIGTPFSSSTPSSLCPKRGRFRPRLIQRIGKVGQGVKAEEWIGKHPSSARGFTHENSIPIMPYSPLRVCQQERDAREAIETRHQRSQRALSFYASI